ncbi:hypothetical protein AN958_12621 [Leucoagaricus sp. SymC.cos]|nr:hypothetical protein AN958_12621 [Leucoagaricus sp. SymC.cos]
MFSHAHDFKIEKSTFTENRVEITDNERSGLRELLSHSMRDAFHDSSARWPPPMCHPGTQEDRISLIVDWGMGTSEHTESIHWMDGPFGVGKSALAQTCAEKLEQKGKLGASLFFSRPNRRNNPTRVFPSISYQIAAKSPPLATIIDHSIRQRPTVLDAALPTQFEQLLVNPLRQLSPAEAAAIKESVIILDGLDELEGPDMQCAVIDLVVTSVRDKSTPFRWFITSRPEPHIIRSMAAADVAPLVFRKELPLSKEDSEILLYVTEELQKISTKHGLAAPWPSKEDIAVIVVLSARLWAYAAAVVRFIGQSPSLGPVRQLSIVLALAPHAQKNSEAPNPLAPIDLLYTLILQQLPVELKSLICKILLFRQRLGFLGPYWVSLALALSKVDFCSACDSLPAVLHLDDDLHIEFYHASFMDYMEDPKRSQDFCIYGNTLVICRHEVLEQLNKVHTQGTVDGLVVKWENPSKSDPELSMYHALVVLLEHLCSITGYPLDSFTVTSLLNFQFNMIPLLLKNYDSRVYWVKPQNTIANIPKEYRKKIIHQSKNPFNLLSKPEYAVGNRPYILGQGKNKLVCWADKDGDLVLHWVDHPK